MNNQIDARGKACPIPVIMAKKEADQGNMAFTILVDNQTAIENLKRFASSNDYKTDVVQIESGFHIAFTKSHDSATYNPTWNPINTISNQRTWAVFVGREGIGNGDSELGRSLLKMFFYTLAQDPNVPRYILFMNAGVKVPVENDQAVEQLKALMEMGSELLVCGTCLNYYDITDNLQIGNISNMYDIVEAMKAVDKVVTI
jgi:selenium metabolism protein YedF